MATADLPAFENLTDAQAAKLGPCRVCLDPADNGAVHGKVFVRPLVAPADGGADERDNYVSLCPWCAKRVEAREPVICRLLVLSLGAGELRALLAGGDGYAERVYGVKVASGAG